ncbi:hypothetical protein N656DRAFT_775829 [Canariomyces notabilis]|uniref:Uncharacterized protein n=1 Tax=Canariomyces notabilis TaxID=2074819 RepID=A0AAN6TJX3_9PEZI|nr:hypothetical protein N656DRAFT_775829 [Canariomyces arenarius]
MSTFLDIWESSTRPCFKRQGIDRTFLLQILLLDCPVSDDASRAEGGKASTPYTITYV